MTTDAALLYDNGALDSVVIDGDLFADDDLKTAVLISLFTDRRADPDDVIPDGTDDRRGWWGDAFNSDGYQIGTRRWLVSREKESTEVLRRVEDYDREALQWLLDDGVLTAVTVTASNPCRGVLQEVVALTGSDGRRGLLTFNPRVTGR